MTKAEGHKTPGPKADPKKKNRVQGNFRVDPDLWRAFLERYPGGKGSDALERLIRDHLGLEEEQPE